MHREHSGITEDLEPGSRGRVRQPITFRIVAAGLLVVVLPALFLRRTPARASAQPIGSAAAARSAAVPALQGEPALEQGFYYTLLGSSYHAPNPAHGLNAYFTSYGVHLVAHSRAGDGSKTVDWWMAMTLVGYGYGKNLLEASVEEVERGQSSIEYRRAGGLTEWYVNSPEGLEQGFTLESTPGTRPEGGRLRLVLQVTGDLHAVARERGQAVALKQADGTLVLSYRGLSAYDARGRVLPAEMRVVDGQVILEVDDAKATYPVTVDPTFTQQDKLFADASSPDIRFGQSVAIQRNSPEVGVAIEDVAGNVDQGAAHPFL